LNRQKWSKTATRVARAVSVSWKWQTPKTQRRLSNNLTVKTWTGAIWSSTKRARAKKAAAVAEATVEAAVVAEIAGAVEATAVEIAAAVTTAANHAGNFSFINIRKKDREISLSFFLGEKQLLSFVFQYFLLNPIGDKNIRVALNFRITV
jgi:hypothetical protein